MTRRINLGKGSSFTSKLDNNETGVSNGFVVTSGHMPPNTITCDLIQFDGMGAASRIDTFSGGFIVKGNKLVAHVFDILNNKYGFRILLRAHPNKPAKDQLIIRTENGIKSLRDQIDGKGNGNPGGTTDDPDAEGFTRNGTPTTTPISIVGGNASGTGSIQPGTVVIKTSSAVNHAYDYNGQLFFYSDAGPLYTPQGTVNYGTGGPSTWSVSLFATSFNGTLEFMN